MKILHNRHLLSLNLAKFFWKKATSFSADVDERSSLMQFFEEIDDRE
jgi:hypothetical protein